MGGAMIQRRKSIFFRLTISFVLLGLAPLLIAGTVLFGRFRDNMERVVLDDMGRMVSYAGNNAEEMVEECSGLTKYIYDISTDDGMFLYQILKSPGLSNLAVIKHTGYGGAPVKNHRFIFVLECKPADIIGLPFLLLLLPKINSGKIRGFL